MSKSLRGLVCLLSTAVLFTTFSFAVTPDRINGQLAGAPKVALRGNVRSLVHPGSDIGRMDGSRLIKGVSLNFRPSAAQQKDLDRFIAELGDRSSPNYHKYLTPKQFGTRFGMSRNDIQKISAWLTSEGFTNIRVSNGRNRISFDGTIAQVESTFATEFHHYLVDGELHFANVTDISVPRAMAEAVIGIANTNDFRPKPRVRPIPHFTSSVSGNHFLTPGDFAMIYGLQGLYDAGIDGAGQTIAVVGQTALITSDLDNFRLASGLSAKNLTQTLIPNTGNSTVFSGDLVESDLDVEWSGGVAKGANINFVYVGESANFSVWDSLQYSVDNNVAPFISTSYGFCEQGTEQQAPGFSATVRTWAVQGIAQGQTIVAASGDAGAADCESTSSTTATTGLAVDMPASIPEVIGMGGNSFSADAPNCTTACPPGGDPPYWAAAGASTDAISSALGYIGESAWNDTTISVGAGGGFSSTGGGVSTLFTKPSYQAGTGFREVPDVSLTATPNHDPYLFCSQPQSGAPPTCTNGFRDSTGNLNIVGGTSAASPSFAAILALINEYLGNSPPAGIAPVNPILYGLATTAPTVFHDVTAGDNKVPCTTGTTNCPTGTTSIGFSAGVGYDDVTGLGSVDAFAMAQAMSTDPGFTLVPQVGSYQVAQGSNITATVNLIALNGFTGPVRYTCTESVSESTCTGPATEVDSSMPASFSITTAAPTAKLDRPFDRSVRIFYATLLPGLLGIVFVAGSRKRSIRGMRLLGLMMVLGFSTLWLGSCGGSSKGPKDPGTPTGSYTITVKGVSGSLTRQTTFQLVVVQ